MCRKIKSLTISVYNNFLKQQDLSVLIEGIKMKPMSQRPKGSYLLKRQDDFFGENEFRQAINNWSKSVKNNPIPEFADHVEFGDYAIFPIYRIQSVRKYEDRKARTVKKCSSPGQYSLVPKVPWNQVDVWAYNLREQDDNHSIRLSDTYYEEHCRVCHATGKLDVRCSTCCGARSVKRTVYENNESRTVKEVCSNCSGHGTVKEKCDTCSGYGGWVHYVVCDVFYTHHKFLKHYMHDTIKDFVSSFDLDQVGWHFFPEVTTVGEFSKFVDGNVAPLGVADLATFINSKEKSHGRFLRENTNYGNSFASLIAYSDTERRNFSLLVVGENDVIYAPVNPITMAAEGFVRDANQYLLEHRFAEAGKALKYVLSIGGRDDLVAQFIKQYKKQLSESFAKISSKIKTESDRVLFKTYSCRLSGKAKNQNIYSVFNQVWIPLLGSLLTSIAVFLAYGLIDGIQVMDLNKFTFSSSIAMIPALCAIAGWRYLDVIVDKNKKYLLLAIIPILMAGITTFKLITGRNDLHLYGAIAGATLLTLALGYLFKDKMFLQTLKLSSEIDELCIVCDRYRSYVVEFMPKENHSYFDVETQQEYYMRAKEIDDLLVKAIASKKNAA